MGGCRTLPQALHQHRSDLEKKTINRGIGKQEYGFDSFRRKLNIVPKFDEIGPLLNHVFCKVARRMSQQYRRDPGPIERRDDRLLPFSW